MNTENVKKINLLPWIKDGSYKTKEWQRELKAKMVEIRDTTKIGRPGI